MANYYRITAYHKEKGISIIMDSYGYFEKKWQFSADTVFGSIFISVRYEFDARNIVSALIGIYSFRKCLIRYFSIYDFVFVEQIFIVV